MKKNLLKGFIGILLISIFLVACSSADTNESILQKNSDQGFFVEDGVATEELLAEAPLTRSSNDIYSGQEQTQTDAANQSNRMIIKNANMTIIVENPKESLNQVGTLAESQGGYIVSSNISEHEDFEGKTYYSADIYVRVPADQFDTTINTIQDIAYSVDYQSVTGQDVTSEYVDLESQLRSLELAEEQLTKIMNDAWDTEDVLNVYRELQNVQSDIEVIKGRMKYLRESSSFSSISVNFQAKATVEPITIGKWSPKGIAADALQALVNFAKGLVNFLIWFSIFALPIILLIVLVIWFLIWLFKKVFHKRKKQQE